SLRLRGLRQDSLFLPLIVSGLVDVAENKKKTIVQVLTESYGDLVKHLARRFGTATDIHDVVQDTYLRAEKMPPDMDVQNLRAYVFRMADNIAIDHLRRKSAQTRYFEPLGDHDSLCADASPEQTADFRQRIAILENVVANLPPRQREVFLMHKFDGLSHSQIAERLGITKSAVEKLIIKALATARARLDERLN
ncbi:RNA polymerase sigma factor, partial [Pseudomonas helleri]|uniref:RNA polymerase sigma factor n=2 Tax=Pseudomonas helleri TaxID=1608996 RepID=UPI003FD09FD2